MAILRSTYAYNNMITAGHSLAELFLGLPAFIEPGMSTEFIDKHIESLLVQYGLISECKGYHGYRHVSCISVNDEVVHGVPTAYKKIKAGDLITVDVCASYKGFCADMARTWVIPGISGLSKIDSALNVVQKALDAGIQCAQPGGRVGDISDAIQKILDKAGLGIVRDFAGHGIGKRMHEDPEILNYGVKGSGPLLQVGMGLAIEPMVTLGSDDVVIDSDGWTARTADGSLAIHIEDTVIVNSSGPQITTRLL